MPGAFAFEAGSERNSDPAFLYIGEIQILALGRPFERWPEARHCSRIQL